MVVHNLPPQPTTFIGRAAELAEIARLLADPACRLLTLVGPGGIGKTRLALQAADDHAAQVADGVWFVPLTPVATPDRIASATAGALQVAFSGSEDHATQLTHYLRQKHMLLVLDNFEHLLDGTALLTTLLQAAAYLKILVTSRERLNVQEEWTLTVDGLSVPPNSNRGELESYGAVQLFVQRAQQVQSQFSLRDNAEAVEQICQHVEGMPLGLELAASWLRVMSAKQVVAQMSASLDFLTTPLRNIPERHRSLRAVFEQSWNLLSSSEQYVLMRLSVFRGGFDLESAHEVAGASLPILAALLDKSLIRLNADARYDLHELLGQYAADKLTDAGEANATLQRHLDYFLKLAEQAEAHAFGREQIARFNHLEIEFDNIRAALAWSLRDEQAETGLRLAAALRWFFSERYHLREGLDWLERMLATNEDAPVSLRAKAFQSAGALTGLLADMKRSGLYCEQALTLARSVNDRWNIAWALSTLAVHQPFSPQQSRLHLEESLTMFRELDDVMGITHTLIRLSWHAIKAEDFAYVTALQEEAARRAREAGDTIMTAWVTLGMADVSWQQYHQPGKAIPLIESSIATFRQARLQIGLNEALIHLSVIEQDMGNMAGAQMRLTEILRSFRETNTYMPFFTAFVLFRLANLARSQGQYKRAAQLLAGASLIEGISSLPEFEGDLQAVREQLDDTAFAKAWAAGQAMTEDDMFTYATEGSAAATVQPPDTSHSLTAREAEILRLMAEGLSNRDIAERLFLTPGTVKWYLSEIYSKLGVNGRVQAIARARELALLA